MAEAEQAGTQRVRLIVVHGIGSQKIGSTAARWADAVVGFARAAGHRTKVSTANLTSSPATVTVLLTPPADREDTAPPTSEIQLEEAFWADSFPEPSLGRVLRFLLTVAPVLAITQSILVWRSREKLWPGGGRTPRVAVHIATLVGPLALGVLVLGLAAPLIAVLLLLVLIASSLPIPTVRRTVGKLLGFLSTTIGDAYLFVADPVNRAAMERRLADRLGAPSDVPPSRTVVLAHSQGAALAYRALGSLPRARRPAALVTVGSGVGRLQEVGLLRSVPWYLTPLFVSVVATGAGGLAWGGGVWTPLLLAVSAGLALLAWWRCASWLDTLPVGLEGAAREKERRRTRGEALLEPIEGMSWLDIWASFDLVPNGRTAEDDGDASYQPAQVAGEQSVVRDHVRYHRDWEQTMPLVFSRMLDPSGPDPVPYVGVRPATPVAGGPGERRRPLAARDRVGLALRAVPLAAVAVVLGTQWRGLFGMGHWLRTVPPDFLDSALDAVFVPLRTLSGFLDATWFRAPPPQALLAVLALLALGLAGSVLTRRVLTSLQRWETTAWLRGGGLQLGRDAPRWSGRRWAGALTAAALAASAVPALLLWGAEAFNRDDGRRLDWTRAQTVEAYLTAVAEDDTRALCDVTAPEVTRRRVDGAERDVCGTEHQDELRTCSDARKGVAALAEDAVTVHADGTVTVSWDPEVPVACDNAGHGLALPGEVALVEQDDGRDRWQVTAVSAPGQLRQDSGGRSRRSASATGRCPPPRPASPTATRAGRGGRRAATTAR